MIEGHDRPALGERALRRRARGLAELAAPRPLADGVALLPQKDRAGRARVDADQAVDDQRQHLVEVEGRREDVRDLEKGRDLTQLPVRLALEATFFDDPGDLVRDRLQEIDLLAAEVARLDCLHVHHTDDLVARDDGHREHRREALLIDLRHPFPARLAPNVARRKGHAGVRDPTDDPLAHPQRRAPDATPVESIRRDEPQQSIGALEEIQR